MKTGRLYYDNSYLTDFTAQVIDRSADGCRICLDRTAFYPSSGGQPHDTGVLGGATVTGVIEEGDRIIHITAAPVDASEVEGRLDWSRRFDHMQQHSGQHLLSAVLLEKYGIATASFHLGEDASTIEVESASLSSAQVAEAERRANEAVMENRPVAISFEDASGAAGLRSQPDREGLLRIVTIEGMDRSACGGTHVRATGEIGPILIRKLERIRGNTRIEFLCGMRAARRARADFEALSAIARLFSAPLDQAPELAAAQLGALQSSEKARRRLAAELAQYRGRELYEATAPGHGGLRRAVRALPSGSIDDELRALARGFTSRPNSLFLAIIQDPPSVLLAVSKDAGVDAGARLKEAVTRYGGRGGGNELVAQGSVPSKDALEDLSRVLAEVGGHPS